MCAPARHVVIAVTDSGSGIPKSLLDKVFQPFFTTKPAGKGSGLGLSMVYGFATKSGGHVRIYSEEGHGTSVKIYLPVKAVEPADTVTDNRELPVADGCRNPLRAGNFSSPKCFRKRRRAGRAADEPEPSPARRGETHGKKLNRKRRQNLLSPAPAADGRPSRLWHRHRQSLCRFVAKFRRAPAEPPPAERSVKILVVEDQEGVRTVATGFLTDFGYEVIEAADGIAALDILSQHDDIDLMFTDVVMPGGLNGFDLAQARAADQA